MSPLPRPPAPPKPENAGRGNVRRKRTAAREEDKIYFEMPVMFSKLKFTLKNLADSAGLAGRVSGTLLRFAEAKPGASLPVFLFMGDLGAGKTTFIRLLVERLPGGADAEVASPSFTLCNVYPTTPEVQHFDLYRLPPGGSDEMLEESLDAGAGLILIEWAEYLPARVFPVDRIEMYWHVRKDAREVSFSGSGTGAEFLALLSL